MMFLRLRVKNNRVWAIVLLALDGTHPSLIVRPSPLKARGEMQAAESLADPSTLPLAPEANENSYLVGPEGRTHNTRLQPRLVFNNFDMLVAAVDGPA
ncbi:MAG: hypothetical protein WAW46_03210 [Polaromonas sp.]